MVCTKCDKWVQGRRSTLTKGFVCKLCVDTMKEITEPSEEISLFDQVDFAKSFCYLGDR